MSTFSGLTNALQSLNAQQYALSVTGDNMDNANTVGYTRKTANLEAVGQVGGVPRIYATQNTDVGTVNADTATRTNDPILDSRNRVEQGLNSLAQTNQTTQSNVETIFDEPSNNGLANQLSKFWASWSTLANSNAGGGTTAEAERGAVLSAGASVASTLNAESTELSNQLSSANLSLSQTVTSINTDAGQVASLNQKIVEGTASDQDVNDLTDQRDALLVTLSNLSGATSSINSDGSATVTLPGTGSTPVTLVSGGTGVTSTASTVATAGSPTVTGVEVGTTAVGTTTGVLQGVLDAVTTTIPGYQASLDKVAGQLASDVNAVQASGYTNTSTPATGPAFFSGTTAAAIAVAITNPDNIAASKTGSTTADTDGSNAAAVAAIQNSSTGADAQYRNMIDQLGNASAAATTAANVQQTVTTSVGNLQQSASGVNIDQETTNILIYQRAYQASSRVLTTVDEMLDTLINHTGTVGL
jgi:flagellar hook-associated protein 1 FlgK